MIYLSIVIPTRNRAGTLGECLRAIDRERRCGYSFEVIVIDDGSTDMTTELVRALQCELELPLRLLAQQKSGPAVARNRGIEAAKGELIAFLGDDVVVDAGCLNSLCTTYESCADALHGVLGHTRYRHDCTPTPFGSWLDKKSDLQFAYSAAVVGEPLHFALTYTSNILIPRRALLEVGGFNPGFRYPAYEDTELGYRLAQRGFKLYYCPTATAVHIHPVSVRGVAARMIMMARALMDLRSLNPELFGVLYPDAKASFAHPSALRRAVRWIRAAPLLKALDLMDSHLPWQLPGPFYRGVINSIFSQEVSRLWPSKEERG